MLLSFLNNSNKPSHGTMKQAIQALTCMEHRGASSADNISGDGAGNTKTKLCII
jgi:glutamate synthase (ferredoxin)